MEWESSVCPMWGRIASELPGTLQGVVQTARDATIWVLFGPGRVCHTLIAVQDIYRNKKQESWSRLNFLFENWVRSTITSVLRFIHEFIISCKYQPAFLIARFLSRCSFLLLVFLVGVVWEWVRSTNFSIKAVQVIIFPVILSLPFLLFGEIWEWVRSTLTAA